MSHANGAHLGGIRTLEDLRGRCVVDPLQAGGCWHLRSARGRPLPADERGRHVVHLYLRGAMTSTRAAWMLHRAELAGITHDEALSELGRRVVYRTCCTHDCCNPAHLRRGSRAQSMLQAMRDGRIDMAKVAHAARATGAKRAVITPELRQWIVQSTQTGVDVAHALGVSQGRVNGIRAEARQRAGRAAPSVFALGDAANDRRRRAA